VISPNAAHRCFRTDWLQEEANRALGCLLLDGNRMDFKFEYVGWPTDGNTRSAVVSVST